MSRLPLMGRRVVVTRAADQADELVTAFETAGAEVARLPLLELMPPADEPRLERMAGAVAAYPWIAFTSANAVRAFVPRIADPPATLPPVATVGSATSQALRAFGVEPALEAGEPRAAGLLRDLAMRLGPGERILLPQAEDARPDLAAGLAAAGIEVETVVAYRKRLPAGAAKQADGLFASQPLGWVTFTSPRIVRHFVELLGASWEQRRRELEAASIGPVTSDELRRRGVEPAAEASRPGAAELVQAVVDSLSDS